MHRVLTFIELELLSDIFFILHGKSEQCLSGKRELCTLKPSNRLLALRLQHPSSASSIASSDGMDEDSDSRLTRPNSKFLARALRGVQQTNQRKIADNAQRASQKARCSSDGGCMTRHARRTLTHHEWLRHAGGGVAWRCQLAASLAEGQQARLVCGAEGCVELRHAAEAGAVLSAADRGKLGSLAGDGACPNRSSAPSSGQAGKGWLQGKYFASQAMCFYCTWCPAGSMVCA